MSDVNPLIVMAAGGTGGHMFPAQALAAELHSRNCRLVLITDRRGDVWQGEAKGIETYRIRAGGIAGKNIFARFKSSSELAIGTLQARKILKRLSPMAVVGFGGYASIPTMLAASHSGFPTAIHEQNAVLGRANRFLAKRVACIATSFKKTEGLPKSGTLQVVHSGMPLRSAVSIVKECPYPSLRPDGNVSLLVIGGSQGARIFSEVVPRGLGLLDDDLRSRIHVSQQCRPEDLERTSNLYRENGIDAELKTFFKDAPKRLANSHLLIGRSGASTVAEALAIGRPAILVPYPHATDDHQTRNAHAVVEGGAGWLMPEESFTPTELSVRLTSLISSPVILEKSAIAARAAATIDAEVHFADLVLNLLALSHNESRAA
ncbi:MAG: undecaprenyldiphospho-muramoylpentapeptide beta-N-acetylglucosaminyltransferase [Pseudomonadota bacterium]|nr:undecaprenyldiphospho-muramoylpentapeptide beta-N-acetylglucosaminyltransferase [Pseudomonadota bacterium]